jgi:simple sugar transport system permease protein
MIGGEFDLSVGATVGASGMLMAGLVAEAGWSPAAAAGAGLALALSIGLFNGALVTRTGLPSFIVTLAVMFALRGTTIALARLATGRTQIVLPADAVGGWAEAFAGDALGLRASILWWVLATAVLGWFLHRRVGGNWILAAGGAPAAARALGVPVGRLQFALFTLTAACAWLVALIQLLRFGGADALRGQGQEFHAIVAAVIGGTLLTGGHGSVLGTAFGALIYGIARQGMVISGVDADWFQAALGALLLGAAWLNHRARAAALRTGPGGETDDGGGRGRAPPATSAVGARADAERTEAGTAAPPTLGIGGSLGAAPRPPPAVLEARAVSRRYGAVRALEGVDLRVRAGRVTCLVGDNGAGKSTLIRILTGVDRPDAGAVHVDGRRVDLGSPADARSLGIGVVLQDLAHAPLLSVWRNFALGLPGAPWSALRAPAMRSATAEAAAGLGIVLGPLERPLATLSGGERQALAIARALAPAPRVLVLDEPTAALGVSATEAVLRLIREARERGTAVLIVTHDPVQAAAIADEVVVLSRGSVAHAGEAGALSADRLRELMGGWR